MDFNKWLAKQPKDPTKPITPRMAWDAAMLECVEAAELEAELLMDEGMPPESSGASRVARAILRRANVG